MSLTANNNKLSGTDKTIKNWEYIWYTPVKNIDDENQEKYTFQYKCWKLSSKEDKTSESDDDLLDLDDFDIIKLAGEKKSKISELATGTNLVSGLSMDDIRGAVTSESIPGLSNHDATPEKTHQPNNNQADNDGDIKVN